MTKVVKIGDTEIGGGKKVAVQSMCNIKTSKAEEVIRQMFAGRNRLRYYKGIC